jgi:hypothetical protein
VPELTPGGAQAYRLLTWAQEDLAARIVSAREQVGALWKGAAPGREQDEIGDAATQLSRLADSVVTMAPDISSIGAQMREPQ